MTTVNPGYWRGKTVLVTGGHGFLGNRVVDMLMDAGAYITTPRSGEYDLRSREAARDLIYRCAPEIVIHLAANVGGIGANMNKPADMFYDNAMMGLNVMNESWRGGVSKLVIAGTVCSYPKYPGIPIMEDDFWNGYPEETNAPYGIAKRMLLAGAMAYRKQYGFNVIYPILTNMYGPGDDFSLYTSHVIPAIIHKMQDSLESGKRTVVLWGTGKATRDFMYVDDAARAILLAAEKYNKPQPVNIASGEEVEIRDLAQIIGALMQYSGTIRWDGKKPDGQPRRVLNTYLAGKEFGFATEVSLGEGLQKTIDWFRQNRQ